MDAIDVLWLVEHVAREMDVACAVKCLAERRFGLRIEIRHVYLHANQVMRDYSPRLVVLPFFYSARDLATAEYVQRWPAAAYFNLAWEEIFYKGHLQLKAPADDFCRNMVKHHAWGEFFQRYLAQHGVSPKNVFVNGNPAYQLYLEPYCRHYQDRGWLAQQYGLDARKRWVFIPENYRWAFVTDKTMKWRVSQGADLNQLRAMRAFAQDSLSELLRWCNNTARHRELEIIIRPKPATMLVEMEAFFAARLGTPKAAGLHFIKHKTVREWILASDVVVSSFSTTLIEAAIADRPAYMAAPLPILDDFAADWYQFLPCLQSEGEFELACTGAPQPIDARLKVWARSEMLANGDPISALANFMCEQIQALGRRNALQGQLREWYRGARQVITNRNKNYFNARTHEDDRFTAVDARRWADAWCATLHDVA